MTRKMLYLSTILMIALGLGLSSCVASGLFSSQGKQALSTEASNSDECISPEVNLAIPAGLEERGQPPTPIPPHGWEMVSELPDGMMDSFVVSGNSLWISHLHTTQDANISNVLRFDLNTYSWKTYSLPYNNRPHLFKTRDGNLWGYYDRRFDDVPANFSLLIRYHASKDQFEFVHDSSGLFNSQSRFGSSIIEDASGLFWFFSESANPIIQSLYTFDPKTLVVQRKKLQLDGYGVYVALGPDENLWAVSLSAEDPLFLNYNPKTEQARYFDRLGTEQDGLQLLLSKELPYGFQPIFFDREGRLWQGNQGWLDISNPDHLVFYSLIPSPVFVHYSDGIINGDPYLVEHTAYPMYQSRDGYLWFSMSAATSGGIVRLKIGASYKQGDWCLITNGSGGVAEDDNGILWMIVFDKIYKRP